MLRRSLVAALLVAGLAPSLAIESEGALQPCRVGGVVHELRCGTLTRPLDPANLSGATIEIGYVVAPAVARQKLADPVFVLAGGPGQSAVSVAPTMLALLSRTRNRRDIVFVDQRGTGRSAPLDCEDPTQETLAEQSEPDRQLQQVLACKARLLKRRYLPNEAALGFFTTAVAVQDLDAVRQALGAPRVNLVGASYGTRVALEYARQFPTSLRRAVLDGVAPPDMALPASYSTDGQAAFDALLAACADEPTCATAYPTLRADWRTLLGSLPRKVSAAHPLTGAVETFTLTRAMVLAAVRAPLYVPSLAAGLPAAIADAAQGRYEGLFGLQAMLQARPANRVALGMHLSVVCAEDLPRLTQSSDRPGAEFGRDDARLYARLCSVWPRGAVPKGFDAISRTRAPMLLLSGGLDPATPPRHGARVAALLGGKARHVVVPNAGHGVMAVGCMRDVVQRFIDAVDDAAALAVDADCAAAIPRPPAFRPLRSGAAPG
ncbi:alpha/beta fold hydrolase [Schlegelella sp. ID0723]|uniref:Alpha/beta fold hydrolase n=2 Tax=Piscinibacter koreensis TaxID=2742824 RepID=A0A7Y6TUU7_9BURK|nr:alpha/beta fold hydrolase [Schlegelella koreensis]NUZ04353.1 alpha/beta fold hydrolase [Schlegelella koreensis]